MAVCKKLLQFCRYLSVVPCLMKRYNHKPEDLSRLLSHGQLSGIQQQFSVLSQFNQVLAELLQTPQLGFCQVANIKDGRAVILCSSAAWATRLKMQRDAILANFRQKILPDLAGLDIEVSPNGQNKPFSVQEKAAATYQVKKGGLSEQNRQQLAALAASSDGPVQQALQRLLKP